jgi:UDP-2-acetamido-2,6-beta-L-arabino-hexul-4-ose reductase
MRIVITGADGFIGKNLRIRLAELAYTNIVGLTRSTTPAEFHKALSDADLVFHLAGVNRPQDPSDFVSGNATYAQDLCAALAKSGRKVPVAFASSAQASLDNPYGQSKLAAERALEQYSADTASPVYIFRLNNVFGKWCRPNYNSAVATFCHNIARGLPLAVHDAASPLKLVYIDDVVDSFFGLLSAPPATSGPVEVAPVYSTTVGEVVETLRTFTRSRVSLLTPRVGLGLVGALYSTYISYLPPQAFGYQVPVHRDPRGEFAEMLKTPDCGQFSYFTAHPGVTRGEHYHHSKTEKFLVIKGTAHFGFRHIMTHETHELVVRGGEARVIETVPGWTHNIANIGSDELIVMLWSNTIYDPKKPDTIAMKVAL